MNRSRSKRYYDDGERDYDSEHFPIPRTKRGGGDYAAAFHRRGGGERAHEPHYNYDGIVTTSYRILCDDSRAGSVIGKSGCIVKEIREASGARINVHDLVDGDDERVIEIKDTIRRDIDGRKPSFSPAQEALFLVHQKLVESNVEEGHYGMRGCGNRVVTRLVVPRIHVGCLIGKGGKIIEQMKMETNTHIIVLTKDDNLPRCVAGSDEIVQIQGDINAVKHAITIISSRLRESQYHDRHTLQTRLHSGPPTLIGNSRPFSVKGLVFQILCPVNKIKSVVGKSDGILKLLHNEVGVDVEVTDPVAGSDDRIIIISSKEDPHDELFPAQEALLHIQTRIVDLVPDKENFIATRLLVPSDEIGCLQRNSELSEMRSATGINIQILPTEQHLICMSGNDALLQIEGEVKVAREALVKVTSILRNHLYQDCFQKEMSMPPTFAPSHVGGARFNGPVVARSILEVVIPEHAVPKLVKKSKIKLLQISELSGANVILIEDGPEATHNVIQIAGTPEQAERAQSLLQGFILSTQEDSP